jgi:CelD/BcsL family acetyltransferase involved in cellulose biosynthesis
LAAPDGAGVNGSATPALPGAAIERHTGLAGLDALAPEWAALCAEAALPPLFGPVWIRAHVIAYERQQDLLLLAARGSAGLAAVLPLVRARGRLRGLPTRFLRAAANQNTVRFDISLRPGAEGEAALQALWRHVAARRDWDCLLLPQTPRGGAAEGWAALAARAGYLTGRWNSKQVPIIHLQSPAPGAPPAGMEQTSRDFRASLRWSRRRLEDMGPLTLERELHPGAAGLEAFYALEAAGWKGHAADGNAVLRKGSAARRFFAELAAAGGAAGQFALHRLRLDGRDVAMSLGLFHEHAYYLIKTTYDEHYSRYSPGHLLTEGLVQECAAAGRSRFDFCGEAYAYEGRWTRERLPHAFLYIFPPTLRGRLLYTLKCGAAERLLRRLRPAG